MIDPTARSVDAPDADAGRARLARRAVFVSVIAGGLLAGPLLLSGPLGPGRVVLVLALLAPYALVIARLLREPARREGPALAFGIGLTNAIAAGLVCAVMLVDLEAQTAVGGAQALRLAYGTSLLLSHALLFGLGLVGFRRGVSVKPAWRVLARGIVDPAVYFGVVLFLLLGSMNWHPVAH